MVTPAPVGRVENYNPAVHKWQSVADENTGFQSLRYDPVAKKLQVNRPIPQAAIRGPFQVLDQLLLPEETRYVEVNGTEDGYSVIKKMQVCLKSGKDGLVKAFRSGTRRTVNCYRRNAITGR